MKQKKRLYGPSLYYASDKNVFDALNQHKVDTPTIMELFLRRNILVSKKTPREDLAKYFARQIHDYQDHKNIASRLGVAPRRERITSMDINGEVKTEDLQVAVNQLKQELEKSGEVVQVLRDGDKLTVSVQYSTVDYRVSEFAQRQVRDGNIEFIKTAEGYIVRNTQNEYVNDVRDALITRLEEASEAELSKVTVSLFDVPSPRLRSKFFHELAFNLPGYQQSDVTAVYVFKAKPEMGDKDEESEDDDVADAETHVERVLMRGQGVTRSEILNELLDKDDYYITKISWGAREAMGAGHDYDIEATFAEPKDCTGFSFILSGVYPNEDGKRATRRRAPFKHEIEQISLVVESKARELAKKLREEYQQSAAGGK